MGGGTEQVNQPIRLNTEHLRSVASLEQLCFTEPWSEGALELLCREGGLGVVIPADTPDGAALAYGGMTLVLDEGAITNIAVRPDCRRQGLGRAIVLSLIEQARALGVTDIYLEVRVSNEAAIALYRSLGFAVVGTRKGFYRHPAEDAFVMHYHEGTPQ